jgi:hypothetical protein
MISISQLLSQSLQKPMNNKSEREGRDDVGRLVRRPFVLVGSARLVGPLSWWPVVRRWGRGTVEIWEMGGK